VCSPARAAPWWIREPHEDDRASVIECIAAGALLWRLRVESRGTGGHELERAERRVQRIVGSTFLLLALYVAAQAGWTLWRAAALEESSLGIVVTTVSLDTQGLILLRPRHPHSDGRTHVVFTPRTLLERLCALIPRPRAHQVTYPGVLASASTFRDDVVPTPTHGVRDRAGAARAVSIDRRLR